MTLDRKKISLMILILVVFGLFLILNNANSPILISNVKAVQTNSNTYSVYMTMENVGKPDIITEVIAKDPNKAFIIGSTGTDGLALPQGAKPSFSSDGAHIMVRYINAGPELGEFIPLVLEFRNAGSVAVKAIVAEPTASMASNDQSTKMDHSMHGAEAVFEISNKQSSPEIMMSVVQGSDKKWRVEVNAENFNFFEPVVEPLVHKNGQGHGHLYLNGLKLQRMYTGSAMIGVLPLGQHTVSVTLNTNDHKAYSVDGKLLSSDVTIEVK